MLEFRKYNTDYYDAFTTQTDDIDFYCDLSKRSDSVLEMGCGNGRVTFPLSTIVRSITGVDLSDAMLESANKKKKNNYANVFLKKENMTNLDLGQKYDLVIAPFRVIQCLEQDDHITGFLDSIKRHLAPKGRCILNAFNPRYPKEEMAKKWPREKEEFVRERTLENGDRVTLSEKRNKIVVVNQVFYVELIYRRYRAGTLIDTHKNSICMKYFYPEEFRNLVEKNGFRIIDSWGGYQDERYGHGDELVLSFSLKNI